MILGELIQSKLYPFYDLKEKLEDIIYYKTIDGIHESVRASVRPISLGSVNNLRPWEAWMTNQLIGRVVMQYQHETRQKS
jgi:hypothetical protein